MQRRRCIFLTSRCLAKRREGDRAGIVPKDGAVRDIASFPASGFDGAGLLSSVIVVLVNGPDELVNDDDQAHVANADPRDRERG